MAVQLPYFQPISWEQANPALTGAQQSQQMVGQGLQNYMMGTQAPYAGSNAYLDNYMKGIQADFQPYTLQSQAMNSMPFMMMALRDPTMFSKYLQNLQGSLPSNIPLPAIGGTSSPPNVSQQQMQNAPEGYAQSNAPWYQRAAQGIHDFFNNSSNGSQNGSGSSVTANDIKSTVANPTVKPQQVPNSNNDGLVQAVVTAKNGSKYMKMNGKWYPYQSG